MSLRDVAEDVARFRAEGVPVALATVVRTWGAGPRGPGAKMALTADARIAGSVSGGCVEAAVVEEGRGVLASGIPKLLHFGVADETAWNVGLSCGGTIDVFVEKLDDAQFASLREAQAERRALARGLIVRGDDLGKSVLVLEDGAPEGEVGEGGEGDDPRLVEAARKALATGEPAWVDLGEGTEAFVDVELPSPMLAMVGGVHISIALIAMAKALGYRTVVIDPRSVFGSDERFPQVDELIQEWPDEALAKVRLDRSSAVATLTHDPKIDDPALIAALRSPAFYVGALGSRRTHEKRKRRLMDKGLTESELSRLHAPVGLDIGARSPEEIALSVMAQIVSVRNTSEGKPPRP
jgi:xanthine dehydrogenase accessory factor